jgi:sec-independent protein translocase protein TatC
MATATDPSSTDTKTLFDPDEFRMTIGEHLEELRKRLIYGLGGFGVVLVVLMLPPVGTRVFMIFCAPLSDALMKHRLPPQLHSIGISDGFMTYLQICIVCALVVAGPWLIYQLWLFIAAGLYPSERKTITKYIPLSVALLLAGVLFVYFCVLPLTMNFFLTFNGEVPLPPSASYSPQVAAPKVQLIFPLLEGDPINPANGSAWFNTLQKRIKIKLDDEVLTLAVTSSSLLATTPSVDEYIDFVFMFMLVFAVAFQLPLVLLALVRVGIVEIDFLRKQRRLVYFIMAIVSAVIAPGDVVTSMIALLGPMLILYEFGIWLAVYGERQRARERAAEGLE